MSEKNLSKQDLQFLLKPRRTRNRLTAEQRATKAKNESVKAKQREIESIVKDLPEAQEILRERQNVRVKISQIKTSVVPGSNNFIGDKINKLEERLRQAHMIEEHHEEVVTHLQLEIGKLNDELRKMAGIIQMKAEQELEDEEVSSETKENSAQN